MTPFEYIADRLRVFCYVQEVIVEKETYVPRFCEDLEGEPK